MIMSATVQTPSPPEIEYPDSDGEPMAENTWQFTWIVVIKEGLEALYRNNAAVFVAGDLLWYPVEGRPDIRMAPDAMVAFGRPKGRRGSYKQWMEGNIPPQVVFEVLSPGNTVPEMKRKFTFYEHYGVQEYYIYDPDHGSLVGWLREGDRLKEVPRMAGFVSPLTGIRFEPGPGPNNLVIFGPDGERFMTYSEVIELRMESRRRAEAADQRAEAADQRAEAADQRAEAADQRADAAHQRAEAERRQAQAERERADAEVRRAEAERERARAQERQAQAQRERAERLAARLRELGVDPD
jgi:Uma2 family endonuclease